MDDRWTTTGDAAEFLAAAGRFLQAHRVELTVPVSVVNNLAKSGPSFYSDQPPRLCWYGGDSVTAIAIQTPPHPMIASRLTAAAATALAGHRERPGRVTTDEATAAQLARAWGAEYRVAMRERLHRLAGLVEPVVDGVTRVATADDAAMIWAWQQAFAAEAMPGSPPPRRTVTDTALAEGRVVLYEIGGSPAAFASVTGPNGGISRVGPVYTPPEWRRRGCGAAVTAAATRTALDRGAEEVLLFTDLLNPTSNALYARLGYVGMLDIVEADLTAT